MELQLLLDVGLVASYGLAINAACLAAFARDKVAAQRREWRIAERTLLTLALLGGTPAAYLARHVLRHKTRKQPFVAQLHAIAALQVAALVAALAYLLERFLT